MAAGLTLPAACTATVVRSRDENGLPPMIHAADLYHYHCDPDDHWDLASIYALAYAGLVDLKGILIDYPVRPGLGDPDVMGVAQMNYCTGQAVPAVVGSPHLMKDRNDRQASATTRDHQGIHWLLETLKNSENPLIINVVGAVTNVALASKLKPGLFAEKCKCIYLNAGSGYAGDPPKQEYNVTLDPHAYAAIFDAPCPIYWMPCVHETNVARVGEYGTYYHFRQGDILPHLPAPIQNFFIFMLGRKNSHEWFSYLNGDPERDLLEKHGNNLRGMWCTAGFLHAAGKKITPEGEIVDAGSDAASVFEFRPVRVSCDDLGFTTWEPDDHSKERFIYHVNDPDRYQRAMTLALKNLLMKFSE
jgi:hypothetical protein